MPCVFRAQLLSFTQTNRFCPPAASPRPACPQECCAAVTRMFVDRRNLAATLKDTRSIVGKLENVIGVVLHIFMFFL